MKNIKVRLEKISDNDLEFEILEQKHRNYYREEFEIDGYMINIHTDCMPELTYSSISKRIHLYLRGYDENYDNEVCRLSSNSTEERDQVLKHIIIFRR